MALGTLTSGSTDIGTTTCTTGSFTPSANATLIAFAGGRKSAGIPAQPTVTDSVGLTWTEIRDTQYNTGGNPYKRLRSFRAVVGASPVSMTVSATISDAGQMALGVCYITGASTDFSNVADATQATGDPSVTLGSLPAVTSVVMGIYWANGINVVSPASGFTEIQEFATANSIMEVCYDSTSPGTTGVWSSANTETIGQLIEIKMFVAAATARAYFIDFLRM